MAGSYIHNYARTLAGRLHLNSHDMRHWTSAQSIAKAIVRFHWNIIWSEIDRETWKTRNNLACEGAGKKFGGSDLKKRVSLCEVHSAQQWIELEWSGLEMIHQIAATAVVAAMADNFWDECERQRAIDTDFLTQNGLVYQS